MSTNSQLSYDKKTWLNSKLHTSLQKSHMDYNMIDDYVYHLVREFVEINTPGKVYTWGSGGLGHIIVVKRDDTDSSILWQMFGTDYKPLDEDDDYINEYTSMFNVILEKRRQVARDKISNTPFSLTGTSSPPSTFNNNLESMYGYAGLSNTSSYNINSLD
jgi:hypothetical protein